MYILICNIKCANTSVEISDVKDN